MAASDAAVERATPRMPRVPRPMTRRWGMIRPDTVLPALLLLVTALIVVYPVGMVLYGSFKDTAPGQPGALTLANWRTVLGDAATFRVLANSILIALPRTILALALATAFAWCVARTEYAVPAPARRAARLHVLPAGAAVGAGVDAPRRAQCRPAQPVARRRAPRPGEHDQRVLVHRAHRPGRRALGDGAVPLRAPRVPRHGRHAGGGGAHGRRQRAAHALADQPAAPAARAPGLGHPLVRGGHGVLRAAAAPRHTGQDLRVHDQDLRPGVRRPRRRASAPPWCWRCCSCSSR